MGNITIQGDLTGGVPGGEVGGASNLTTVGAIPYVSASGVLNQDATKLFWDATNKRLGVGTNAPTASLHVIGLSITSADTTVGTGSSFAFQARNSTFSSLRLGFGYDSTKGAAIQAYEEGVTFNRFMMLQPSGGNIAIGTTTDDGSNKLQVDGYIKSTGISLGAAAATVEGIGFNRRVSDGVIFNSAHAATQFTNNNPTGTAMFEVYNGAGSFVGRSFGMFLASANSIVGTGNTSDGGYRLDITHSGSSGTLRVYDQTATTGVTTCVVRDGAAQAGSSSIVVQNSSSQYLAGFTSNTGSTHGFWVATTAGGTFGTGLTAGGVQLSSTRKVTFSSTTDAFTGTADLSLSRASAGVLQVGDGGANANGYLSAARIGVGTASPSLPLEVNGDVKLGANANWSEIRIGVAHISTSGGTSYSPSIRGGSDSSTATFLRFDTSSLERARITSYGNLLIGGTTDGNYKLDVQKSHSSGTLRVYDQTATTGSTLAVIQAGAGQSGNLLSVRNNAGSEVLGVNSGGNLTSSSAIVAGQSTYFEVFARSRMYSPADGVFQLTNNAVNDFSRLQFGGTTSSFPSLKRNGNSFDVRLADDSAYAALQAVRLQTAAQTVSQLPAAAAAFAGSIQYVTDANATTIGSTVAGGGSNKVMVWCDGTNWKIYAN